MCSSLLVKEFMVNVPTNEVKISIIGKSLRVLSLNLVWWENWWSYFEGLSPSSKLVLKLWSSLGNYDNGSIHAENKLELLLRE